MTSTRELPTLALRLFGVMPPFPFSFKKPGPCHKARLMAFCLYCLKMLLLIRQLNMDEVTQEGLVRLGIFFAVLYIPHFLKASVGADAAFNNISLYKQLVSFIDMDGPIATAPSRCSGGTAGTLPRRPSLLPLLQQAERQPEVLGSCQDPLLQHPRVCHPGQAHLPGSGREDRAAQPGGAQELRSLPHPGQELRLAEAEAGGLG